MARRVLAVLFAAIVVLTQVATVAAASAAGQPSREQAAQAAIDRAQARIERAQARIDKGLAEQLTKGKTRFVVEFAGKASLGAAARITNHDKRGRYVMTTLAATARNAQTKALQLVAKAKGARPKSYWLTNVLVVTGDEKLAQQLADLDGVTRVRPQKTYPLVRPVKVGPAILAAVGDPEWGIGTIGADKVWADGITGQGIVVATIDTGVEYTHDALVEHYRGNNHDGSFSHDYNWWDPANVCSGTPCDNVFHGTHTMGTIVGGDGPGPFKPDIGVAPGAEWIAAKGCEDFDCTEESLLSSGQWVIAPTDLEGGNPRPDLRPDIVSNSWGNDNPNDTFYLETVEAWRAAGIIPVFAAGNAGPGCSTAGTPGNLAEVISVGATNKADAIAQFSSRGPSPSDKVSPNVVAPGDGVLSSVPGNGYETASGTSMAAPHTAGAIALMLSARTDLLGKFEGVLDALNGTAVDKPDDACGTPDPSDKDPNFVYGEGRIDAKAAVDLVKSGGTLAGQVTDAGSTNPIPGARVTANNGDREFSTTADENGTYSLFLAAGTYTVTAVAFGYAPSVQPGVAVATNQTTIVNFALVALPRFTVTGHVTASEDRSPIAGASVVALGTPVPTATTDSTGFYSLSLPIGDYTLRASAGGCTEVATAEVSVVDRNVVQDFSLFRKLDDAGHGCRPIAFEWVDAQTQTALFGDEFAGRLRLPFAFEFYGKTYGQVFLSDNGYLNFLAADQYNAFPVAIPSPSPPNGAIYPFWQDLQVDDQSSIDYDTVGASPDRAFVVEYSAVKVAGSSARVSFEVKLWENGTIDMLYGRNPANPGDGRNAGIGIENETGTDALQFSFLEGLLAPNSAFRYEHVPTGLVRGTVTNANDGEPVAGATVEATPGGRHTATGEDGTYSLRLRPGSYTITASALYYVTATSPVTITDGGDVTRDFPLKASIAAVEPAEIDATVDYGETTTATINLSNPGSAPLAWTAKERDQGVELPPLPIPTARVVFKKIWGRQPIPAGFPRLKLTETSGGALDTIITDPAGDSKDANDVTAVRAGSDGSAVATLAIDFAPTTPMNQIGGYVYLDTDQNPNTGLPAEAFFGLPTQDVGMEYIVGLFDLNSGVVPIFDANTFDLVAVVEAVVEDHTARFDMPLSALGGDDGFIDTAMVVGLNAPSDWAPDVGHGTIQPFTDLPWLSESPDAGVVEVGAHQRVTVTLGGATLTPGVYHGLVVFVTNAPRQTQVAIQVTLTVTLPAEFGAISGTVTDAHTDAPLGGVGVTVHTTWQDKPLDLTATTAGDGTYSVTGPAGTWSAGYARDGYVAVTRDVTIAAGVTTPGVDVSLHKRQPHAQLDAADMTFILTPGRTGQAVATLSNPEGHGDLTFTIGEVNLDPGPATMAAAATPRKLPAGADPNARSTRGLFSSGSVTTPPAIEATGDVLASWNAGLNAAWGVGFNGDVWLSDAADVIDVDYTTGGERLRSFPAPVNGLWAADMAWDPNRRLTWQVNVGGDNGIYGIDPTDGSVAQVITGSPWDGTSQRGLAYDPNADVFYIGGWNEGIVYRVAGPSHATPGQTLSQCNPPDSTISGLAWNGSFSLLWEATNSETDTIFLLDPATCEAIRAIPHPDGGDFGGAGLEIDAVGNLWTVGQNTGNAYLVESGLPTFSDVPWLSVSPSSGTVAPDGSTDLTISVDTAGLAPGAYRAIVVVQTNDPDNSNIQVPVLLIVPAYQQGINAGGPSYTTATGDVFATDRKYAAGAFGYVGTSSARRSTSHAIDGTTEDGLYQDARSGMRGYRFDVPDGHYLVTLNFAEIQSRKVRDRVFSVSAEGTPYLFDIDLTALVGRYVAYDRSFEVDVTDGRLDIDFTHLRGDPMVNGILVTQLPEGVSGQ